MNPAQLLAHFDRMADAPDAVPRLRRFVLDLAVRGKLVEQDTKDEPALELLKRIQVEIAERDCEPLSPEEVPFNLPAKWAWTRLGGICSKTGSGSTPRGGQSAYQTGGVPFLRSQNIYDDGLRLDDVAYIDRETHKRMEGTIVKPADLLLNITGGSMGRCCRVPDTFAEANISQHVAIIRTPVRGVQDFLHRVVLSPYFQSFIFDEQTGAGRGGLPKNKMDRIPVALPPLAEQQRIVAKVDELMALCDRLEAAQTERESRRDRLVAASLQRLNQPAEDATAFRDHARFALDNLPRLATRPEHVTQLRQTILNLAVRGKLIPQDLKDEPAAALLTRIRSEREKLVRVGDIKKLNLLPDIDLEQAPFNLPSGWSWARFPELGEFNRGKSRHRPRNDPSLYTGGKYKLVQTGDVARANGTIETYTGLYNDVGLAQSRLWPKGTMCITIAANIADSAILGFDACIPDSVVGFIPVPEFGTAKYFEFFMRTAKASLVEFAPATAQKNINIGILETVLIPIPPLAEQQRIVARVEELMGVCDRLESQLTAAKTENYRLLEAVLHEALHPAI